MTFSAGNHPLLQPALLPAFYSVNARPKFDASKHKIGPRYLQRHHHRRDEFGVADGRVERPFFPPPRTRYRNSHGQRRRRLSSIGNDDESEFSSSSYTNSLNEFRSLMGTLYGVAGAAHFADCYLGPSALLTSLGSKPYVELGAVGKLCVFLWCSAGPLAFAASRWRAPANDDQRRSFVVADAGLVWYGIVEVGCALLSFLDTTAANDLAVIHGTTAAARIFSAANAPVVVNAVGVQIAVTLSWLYSAYKDNVENE